MLFNHFVLALLWIVYCVLHSVLAGLRTKKFFQKLLGKIFRYYRLAYTIFSAGGLAALVWFQLSISSQDLFTPTVVTKSIGITMGIAGLLVMAVCIKKYFINLSGLRSLVQEDNVAHLEVTGLHRHVRHPLYLGTFLFLWGLLIVLPTVSLLVTVSIITFYTLIGIRLEEKKLVLQFGDAYTAYQKKVPMLVPG